MSVRVRPYKRGGWQVDVMTRLPCGSLYRERRRLATRSKSAAQRWGEERQLHLLQHGRPKRTKEVPTFQEFAPRFMDGYARANRQKPSGIAAKETILNTHLLPLLGARRLDAITTEQVQRLKHALKDRAPKTVDNVLTVLNVLLKKAVESDVIERMPCTIRLLPIPRASAGFYDFDECERLIDGARAVDRNAQLIVLLGGEAGLRCGELIALEWSDIDLAQRQLRVQRSQWKGHFTATKGGRVRFVPLTMRLAAALRERRQVGVARVLCQRDGSPLTQKIVQDYVRRAARGRQVEKAGVHRLRHTFCSHLAMRGAPARAIQELAGHQDLATTQRYMHLSPAAVEGAIRLLDSPRIPVGLGNIVATRSTEIENSFR
jgi:integrase